jgi:hypothetical protein
VPARTLDEQYNALSFFSEGGFRFFLPAYLIADLRGALQTAEPLFHLTGGFTTTTVRVPAGDRTVERSSGGSVLLNPRRYGAITFEDYARFRLSVFSREEACAIVTYLRYRRDTADLDITRREVDAALTGYWLDRAEHAPSSPELADHIEREQAYLRTISPD